MRLAIAIATPVALLALVACPAAKVPTGPPPEYEDPPAPSWLEAGVKPAPASVPASSPEAGSD